MRAAASLRAALAIGMITIWLPGCASDSESGPTILAGIGRTSKSERSLSADQRLRDLTSQGPIHLPHRSPPNGGTAYRLNLEVDGERATRRPNDSEPQPPVRESHVLEVELRTLPVEGREARDDVFLVGLDALRYTQKQQNPPVEREIEIADDRLRIMINGETSVDNRGKRVIGPFEPRLFLNRIFGVISHDASGNPTKLDSRGAPAARQLMQDIPALISVAYSMVTLPRDPIAPGSSWTGVRIPVSASGELGLSLTIHYALTSYEIFDGVPCAMITLAANVREIGVTGAFGHQFDRVEATLRGRAWVELESSLIRRVVLNDQIKAGWVDAGDPRLAAKHLFQHQTQLELALRDATRRSDKWSDKTPRFNTR